jgi:hypothetical protein
MSNAETTITAVVDRRERPLQFLQSSTYTGRNDSLEAAARPAYSPRPARCDRPQNEESNMQVIKRFTTSIAASLLLSAVAHASGTSLPWNVETLQQVSPAKVQHYAELDRTSKIGTGTAAAPERTVESVQRVSPAKTHYPESQWSSVIGTGTAATLKR